MTLSRRQFIGCSAAIAAMAGGRVGNLAFAQGSGGSDEVIVVVFLRGGCDGLSLVSPYDDQHYVDNRGDLALQNALTLNINNPGFGATSNFGLHPKAQPLMDLYTGGQLAILHAAGLDDDTRSHFDAMDYMERGTPGNKNTASGWLTRHLQAISSDDASKFPTIAAGAAAPASLLANSNTIATTDPDSYSLWTPYRYGPDSWIASMKDSMLNTLDGFYGGSDIVNTSGKRTIETIRELRKAGQYTPRTGITYPDGGFGDSLKTVAQMIKLDVGLRVATVDLGGWDHHENEAVNQLGWGPFPNHAGELAQGLRSFYDDVVDYKNKVTVVVMSEFGRRLGVNASGGTDHGHGNMMMVLGGNVNGGKIYGKWPGLEQDKLDQQQDLAITTDFRTVLSEIIAKRLGNAKLGAVFPGITPEIYSAQTSLNILRGSNGTLDYTSSLESVFVPLIKR